MFDATDNLLLTLHMLPPVLDTLKVNAERCHEAALGDGTILATELADYLVGKGVAFRDAHEVAGRAVRASLESRTRLHEMPLAALRALDARIGDDVYAALTLKAALAKRDVLGGTAPGRVRAEIERWQARLKA